MHSHHGSSWDKGCHNPVLKEMGVFFHLGLALAVQCHNSFGRSLQVPLGWLWLRLAFSWRRIQVCRGQAGSSATGDSWICRGGLSPSHFRSSGTSSPWECCCSFPAAEVGDTVSGSRRNVEAGTAWIVTVLVPSLLQKSGEAPPKIISHGWLQSHGGSSRSQQQAESCGLARGPQPPDAGCSRPTAEAALPAEGAGLETLSPSVLECWG